MNAPSPRMHSDRYTGLSDRFRSLWTFYQFLSGVFKHLGKGEMPLSYDFQPLYRRLQELVPRLGVEDTVKAERELDVVEKELQRIHAELAAAESGFSPSTLRRFFDHLKRQDEKILFALVKFYLLGKREPDALDKLDILLTRLAEATLEDGRVVPRAPGELLSNSERLCSFGGVSPLPEPEARSVVAAVREIRSGFHHIEDFSALMSSGIFDRFRKLKHELGDAYLDPTVLVEIMATNIEGKNRFKQLFQEEEVRILDDTNRIMEIERYLEKNPELAHESLIRQIETFRKFRARFDSGRKEDNLKRDDILELRRAMHAVLDAFDRELGETDVVQPAPVREQTAKRGAATEAAREAEELGGEVEELAGETEVLGRSVSRAESPHRPVPRSEEVARPSPEPGADNASGPALTSVSDLVPPDPLLTEPLHKLIFALELVVWDYPPAEAVRAKEVHNLRLDPWEAEGYQKLASNALTRGSCQWELQLFYLLSAALRAKMEEETEEIARLRRSEAADRLHEMLERSAQSLERARDMDRRFQWFIDDMLYRGETDLLEQILRSRFRFLRAYSQLWLDHQACGGIPPL